jgi:hypothetical protein
MPKSIQLSFNLLLPLLFGGGSFALLNLFSDQFGRNAAVYIGMGTITLLLTLLPVIIYRLILKSQIQEGFALLNDGTVHLPEELSLRALLSDAIEGWIPFSHSIQTIACLVGKKERIFVTLELDFTLEANQDGKQFAEHIDQAVPQLEQVIQHCFFKASQVDPDMANSLDGSVLLNEDDEAVLKSKFLSALELIDIQGVHFPVSATGIRLNRSVRKETIQQPVSIDPIADELPDDEDLMLNDELLKSLGVS